MQRRTVGVLVAAVAAALPLIGQADTMDYSFAELGFIDAEYDDFDADGDGFALRGGIEFHETYFAWAQLEDLSFDRGIDVTDIRVGAGGHWPIAEKIDVVGLVGIVRQDIDGPRGLNGDNDGFTLGAHVRGEVRPKLELEGGLDYVDVDDGSDTVISLEGRYFFIDNVSGGLRLEFGDRDAIGIAARLTF